MIVSSQHQTGNIVWDIFQLQIQSSLHPYRNVFPSLSPSRMFDIFHIYVQLRIFLVFLRLKFVLITGICKLKLVYKNQQHRLYVQRRICQLGNFFFSFMFSNFAQFDYKLKFKSFQFVLENHGYDTTAFRFFLLPNFWLFQVPMTLMYRHIDPF